MQKFKYVKRSYTPIFIAIILFYFPTAFSSNIYTDYAYVFCTNSNNIAQLGIKPDGTVDSLSQDIITAGVGNFVDGADTSPDDRYIYFVNWNSNDVSMYSHDDSGSLVPIRNIPVSSQVYNPFSIKVDPSGKYAYITGFASNDISMFKIESDGTLTVNKTMRYPNGIISSKGNGPKSINTDSGDVYYVINSNSNDISIYDHDSSTGDLLPRNVTIPTHGVGGRRIYIAISKFLYVTNENSNDVSMYNILDGGGLKFIGLVGVGINPIFFTGNHSGSYAYVPNMQSNSISMFAIDAKSGILNKQPPPEISVKGIQPRNLYSRNEFFYLANQADNSIEVFKSGSTGQLTEIQYFNLPRSCINPRGMSFIKSGV